MQEINKARKLYRDVANAHSVVETNEARPMLAEKSESGEFPEDEFSDYVRLTSENFVQFVMAFATLLDDLSIAQVVDHSLSDDLGCLAHCLRRAVLGDDQVAQEVK